jgi:hypothetical protein
MLKRGDQDEDGNKKLVTMSYRGRKNRKLRSARDCGKMEVIPEA